MMCMVRSRLGQRCARTQQNSSVWCRCVMSFELPSQLRDAAADLPERWWFAADVNDVMAKRLGRREPKKHMQARCPLSANCI